jgi:anti-sigma B factor antagonist
MRERNPVVVMEVPTILDAVEGPAFFDEVSPLLENDRPNMVFDCSQLRHVDSAGIEILLQCMEEAMKRDGDVKLAAVSPACEVILELMRVDRVFEMFATTQEAVRSFSAPAVVEISATLPWYAGGYGLADVKVAS